MKIVIVTESEEDRELLRALTQGAEGTIVADIEPEALLSALGAARLRTPRHAPALTPREKQILAGVARGLANKQIAYALGISEHTVKNHLRNIMEKLRVQNRVQAAMVAIRQGLIPQDAPAE